MHKPLFIVSCVIVVLLIFAFLNDANIVHLILFVKVIITVQYLCKYFPDSHILKALWF